MKFFLIISICLQRVKRDALIPLVPKFSDQNQPYHVAVIHDTPDGIYDINGRNKISPKIHLSLYHYNYLINKDIKKRIADLDPPENLDKYKK